MDYPAHLTRNENLLNASNSILDARNVFCCSRVYSASIGVVTSGVANPEGIKKGCRPINHRESGTQFVAGCPHAAGCVRLSSLNSGLRALAKLLHAPST